MDKISRENLKTVYCKNLEIAKTVFDFLTPFAGGRCVHPSFIFPHVGGVELNIVLGFRFSAKLLILQ